MRTLIGFKRVVFAAVAAIVSVTAFAADWVVDTSAKTLTLMDGEAVVWKFNCSFSGEGGKDIKLTELLEGEGDLDLRNIPDGYKVVNLGTVFWKNSKGNTHKRISSLVEPDALTVINQYEFYNYNDSNDSNFTNFTGGGSVVSIGADAFRNCGKLKGKLAFRNAETMLGGLGGCPSLAEVSMPKLTKLPDNAFSGCSSVTNFDLTWEELGSVGQNAFKNCSKFKADISLPKSTTSGGWYGTPITSFSAPFATSISQYAFFNCSSLTNLEIGAEVTSVNSEGRTFEGCSKIASPVCFPKLEKVPDGMFSGCSKIPSAAFVSASSIGGNAFFGCSSLTNFVYTPSLLTKIGANAFVYSKLTGAYDFPELLEFGGFKWVDGITSISAPKAQIVNGNACYGMVNLKTLVLGSGVTSVTGDENLTNCGKLTGDFDFAKVVSFPRNFMAGTKIGSVRLDSATTFASGVFSSVPLTNIVLGAATALPASLFNGAKPGCCVDFLADVPTFGSLTFPATTTTLYRFFVRDRKYLVAWQNACFALRGSDAYEPYRVGAPRRTIGVMYANSEQSAVAYVVDGTPSGMAILVR